MAKQSNVANKPKQTTPTSVPNEKLKRLVLENLELRETVANLALETAILREALTKDATRRMVRKEDLH
ncbi:hypothetical protein SSBR45G_16830 [Bradyrhizobium sp. SSBR45G]|uniref:hypothetical protein n=1 Tax=unclassified Bradyrhizobium TaxID=2631580 RepID=UPI0023429823|nr:MULTISPECIES: hypothetical protein [unclassified Bradyrhizobium]GLH76775.1 hypothetical protein SSBR45G_16830 [Bradyrhizobium sp. SSBR45G]GLH83533.1 hypothetical protein SSBR45R_09930 [Bradyrhizobium sp. SSBR45R]